MTLTDPTRYAIVYLQHPGAESDSLYVVWDMSGEYPETVAVVRHAFASFDALAGVLDYRFSGPERAPYEARERTCWERRRDWQHRQIDVKATAAHIRETTKTAKARGTWL